jgi:DNA-directed RNA polymerase specialized sigma subunit
MSVWQLYNSAVIISLLCAYVVQSFLPKQDQQIIRNVLSRMDTPDHIKKRAQQIVCYHYIPFALSETNKFIKKYHIPQGKNEDFYSVALSGLIKGVCKYNWTRENTNLHVYLKKYILGEMYKNVNAHTLFHETYKHNPSIVQYNTRNLQQPQHQYPSQDLYDTIIQNVEKLSPCEKRLFYTVYNKYTLRRTTHKIRRICELNGIGNEETYRIELHKIMNKLKKGIINNEEE